MVLDLLERALETADLMHRDYQNQRSTRTNRTTLVEAGLASPFDAEDVAAMLWPVPDHRQVREGRVNAMALTESGTAKHRRYALLEYLEDPVPDADLVLVWEKAVASGSKLDKVPKKLSDAVKACGGTVSDHGLPAGKGQARWFADHVDAASVQLTRSARDLLAGRLGEDLNRLGGVLTVLEATFGPGAGPLGPDDVEPFIGDAGGVPPWDLTDALDAGRVSDAVTNVRRMVQGGGRHPLQVMATLTTHYGRMLRLDGSGIRSEKDAAALLGMKGSTYPAKKALAATAKLGSARIARAVRLLAVADVDLRGRTATPPEQVLEVLVARLASLAGRSR